MVTENGTPECWGMKNNMLESVPIAVLFLFLYVGMFKSTNNVFQGSENPETIELWSFLFLKEMKSGFRCAELEQTNSRIFFEPIT